MATFVLVHGAWQGASTWEPVADRLRRASHRVYTPALTGTGERGHQLTPEVTLDTHIGDLVGLLRFENLRDVVLVGHSYGGMVVTGAMETEADRVSHLVYLDALVPRDGDSGMSLFPEHFRNIFREQAKSLGDGWRLPGLEKRLDLWGLAPGPHRDFVRSKLCDFSVRCFEQPIRMPNSRVEQVNRTYVACTAPGYPARPIFEPFARRAKESGWRYFELPTGHDCHVEMADELTQLLVDVAAAPK